MAAELFRYRKARSVICAFVNTRSGTQLLDVAAYPLALDAEHSVGKHGTYVVVDDHLSLLEEFTKGVRCLPICMPTWRTQKALAPLSAPFDSLMFRRDTSAPIAGGQSITSFVSRVSEEGVFQRTTELPIRGKSAGLFRTDGKPPIIL